MQGNRLAHLAALLFLASFDCGGQAKATQVQAQHAVAPAEKGASGHREAEYSGTSDAIARRAAYRRDRDRLYQAIALQRELQEEEVAELRARLERYPLDKSDAQMCQWIRSELSRYGAMVRPIGRGGCLGMVGPNPWLSTNKEAKESSLREEEPGLLRWTVGPLRADNVLEADSLKRLRSAEAVLVDLRGSSGDDLAGVWGVIESWFDKGPIRPLANMVVRDNPALRKGQALFRERYPEAGETNPSKLSFLVGAEVLPERREQWTAHTQVVAVLIDEDCQTACQLLAQTVAHLGGHAFVEGSRFNLRSLTGREGPSLFEMLSISVSVYVPTVLFEIKKMSWGLPKEGDEGAALHSLRTRLAAVRLFRKNLPASRSSCARLPATPLGQETPFGNSSRKHRIGHNGQGWEEFVRVRVALPPKEAKRWIDTCPGLRHVFDPEGVQRYEDRYESVFDMGGSIYQLSRLFHTELVIGASTQRMHEPTLHSD